MNQAVTNIASIDDWVSEIQEQHRSAVKLLNTKRKPPSLSIDFNRDKFNYSTFQGTITIPSSGIGIDKESMRYIISHELGHYYGRHELLGFYVTISGILLLAMIVIHFPKYWPLALFVAGFVAFNQFLHTGTMIFEWAADARGAKIIGKKAMIDGLRCHANRKGLKDDDPELVSKIKNMSGEKKHFQDLLGTKRNKTNA